MLWICKKTEKTNLLFSMMLDGSMTTKEYWQYCHDDDTAVRNCHTFCSRWCPVGSIISQIFCYIFRNLADYILSRICHLARMWFCCTLFLLCVQWTLVHSLNWQRHMTYTAYQKIGACTLFFFWIQKIKSFD